MRALLLSLALFTTTLLSAGEFSLHVTAHGMGSDLVSLYRYTDLFTLRTELVARGMLDSTGTVKLGGKVEGTARMQLRVGERYADLYLRPGSDLHVTTYDPGTARTINGSSRLGIEFTVIDPLDVNALTTDLNERIDAFITEDLATDEAAGMQVLEIQRKEGTSKPDSTTRPPTLFVTPVLSKARVDSFAVKLRRFYQEVNDPWFTHYLDNSIAGLYLGPRTQDRDLFERFVQGRAVRYDDPEYVRLIRSLYNEDLERLHRDKPDSLRLISSTGKSSDMIRLFQSNDLLRDDDRLAEVVMIDQLYLHHPEQLVANERAEAIIADVAASSIYPEHRVIASNMMHDLTLMRVGTELPAMRLEDERGQAKGLDQLLDGPMCLAFTADWCSYCAAEITSLIALAEDYKGVVSVVIIGLDGSLEDFNAMRKRMPASSQVTWIHAVAEQQVRDDLKLRSLPAFYLLNGKVLARSPAPLPSRGLAELFFKARTEANKGQRLKVWDD
ncbi:MAG: redoxin domain-containing protein [Flavobacteriales bacterium]|nr:redoxin domain-containing protein [Flavobacteriales bacterium]